MKLEFASSLTRDDSWMLELAHIPAELREDEAALQSSRWFDYRHLLPAQATLLFATTYEEVYREKYAQLRDYRDAHKVAPLRGQDIFKSTDLLPLWRARQAADRIGCRYDFYLRFAFDRAWERGWAYMPRPNQLYGEDLVLDVADAWAELRRASLQLARSERFKMARYNGHPDQDAYHDYLIEQVRDREHPHLVLARLIYREKCLPAELAGEQFGSEVLRRAYLHFYS